MNTEMNIHKLIVEVKKIENPVILFVDFARAYNTVNQNKLMKKLWIRYLELKNNPKIE